MAITIINKDLLPVRRDKQVLNQGATTLGGGNYTGGSDSAGLVSAITAVPTPADNQVAVWTDADTLEGTSGFTFNGSTLNVVGTITGTTITGANVTSGADPGHTHTAYEPHDDDLTAIATLGYASTSFLKKTGVNTWALDTTIYESSLSNPGVDGYVLSSTATGVRSWVSNGSMVYPDAGIALSTGSAWGTSITNNSANWNTAYGWGNHASAGYAPTASPTFTGTVTTGGHIVLPNDYGIFAKTAAGTVTGVGFDSDADDSLRLYAGASEKVRITSTGMVGFGGCTAAVYPLHIKAAAANGAMAIIGGETNNLSTIYFTSKAAPNTSYTWITAAGTDAGYIAFSVSDSERARVSPTGMTITDKLYFSGSATSYLSAGANYIKCYYDMHLYNGLVMTTSDMSTTGPGTITATTLNLAATTTVTGTLTVTSTATATNFILSSDVKLKSNIKPLTISPLNIEYKEFNHISDPTQLRYGVIAQDLIKVAPELVRTADDGTLSVAYVDLLIKEVAYLKYKVDELNNRLNNG